MKLYSLTEKEKFFDRRRLTYRYINYKRRIHSDILELINWIMIRYAYLILNYDMNLR